METFEEEVLPVESEATLTVAQPAELPEIKLFGRWSCDDVQVSDMSLQVSLLHFRVEVCRVDVVPFLVSHANSASVMVNYDFK